MKKFISIFMMIILLSTMSMPAFAVANSSNSKLDSKTLSLLKDSKINVDDIIIVDENSVYSPEQLKKIQEEEATLKNQGLTKVTSVYYIRKASPYYTQTAKSASAATTIQTRVVNAVRQYNSSTQTLNSNSHGIRYWLDVIFNLTIGSTTKYAWKACTILGLVPSNFLADYQSGDMLTNHYQYVYYDKITEALNPRDNTWYSCVRTTNLVLTNYVDLYTLLNNSPFRKESFEQNGYYTQHYYNTDWIYNEAATNVYYCGMTITYDTFK